jgi:DNA-binding beta-propeller fold protein YncE
MLKKTMALALLGLTFRINAASASSILSVVADIPLPGRATRFDYQGFDPETGILCLSHMGDGELLIFDTKARKVLAQLPGYANATGVLSVPQAKKIYVSVPGTHEVAVLDMKTLKDLARIPAGHFPDGLAYALAEQRIFVSDEDDGQETVIDARTNKKIGTIDLGGGTGNTQYDEASKHIFANVQSRGDMVEIDPGTLEVIERHPLGEGRSPHGLLIYATQRLAFVACEGNAKLLVVSMKDFQVLQTLPTGDDPDVLAFDPGLGLLYVACEGDTLSVFKLQHERLTKLADEEPGKNCHTIFVDPKTHLIYLPLKNFKGKPILRIMRPLLS